MKNPNEKSLEIVEDGYLDPNSKRKRELAALFDKDKKEN